MLLAVALLVDICFAFKTTQLCKFGYTKLFNNGKNDEIIFSDFTALYENLTKQQLDELSTKIDSFEENVRDSNNKTYVNDLFNRLPLIPPVELTAVRSKANVKGRIGTRAKLVRGNGELALDPGVYNGLHPIKHVKKRIIRELKVKLDWYAKSICKPLKDVYDFYTFLPKHIHPLQYHQLKSSLHLLYSGGKVEESFAGVLEQLSRIKAQIYRKTSQFCIELDEFKKCRDAFMYVKQCVAELDKVISDNEKYIKLYQEYRSYLRKIPTVDIKQCTVAIIGHVNVGKSTLFNNILRESPGKKIQTLGFENCDESTKAIVSELGLGLCGLGETEKLNKLKKLSLAKGGFGHAILSKQPQIAPYNFTTKAISPSQYIFSNIKGIHCCQLLDTPGLLPRNSRFNPYEKLTYTLLRELYMGVIFAVDLTDTNLDDQKRLHDLLRNKYNDRPW